jgi:transcriptional regulator with XRE-family HTH domain
MTDFAKALRETMEECNLRATFLAEHSGLTDQQISAFRNGKRPMQSDNLQRLIDALPPTARIAFFSKCMMSKIGDREIAELLKAIATEMRRHADENEAKSEKSFALVSN